MVVDGQLLSLGCQCIVCNCMSFFLSNDCLSQGDSKHDTKIFSLSVLLSSTLVLNSQGTIDNRAIEELQYPSIPSLYITVNGLDCYYEFPDHVWFGLTLFCVKWLK